MHRKRKIVQHKPNETYKENGELTCFRMASSFYHLSVILLITSKKKGIITDIRCHYRREYDGIVPD